MNPPHAITLELVEESLRTALLERVANPQFVYRDPRIGDYATQQALAQADTVSPLAAPAALLVADLLV